LHRNGNHQKAKVKASYISWKCFCLQSWPFDWFWGFPTFGFSFSWVFPGLFKLLKIMENLKGSPNLKKVILSVDKCSHVTLPMPQKKIIHFHINIHDNTFPFLFPSSSCHLSQFWE
jgi:hypothetical protein